MTKVFLLGSFHFHESDFDFSTTEAQQQLEDINDRLSRFEPDTICGHLSILRNLVNACENMELIDYRDYLI